MYNFCEFAERPLPALTVDPLPHLLASPDEGEPLVCLDEIWYRIQAAPAYADLPGAVQGCWLRRGAAERLAAVSALLPDGYSLLVYDAWRPVAVQQALYDQYRKQLRKEHPRMSGRQLDTLCREFVALPRADPINPAPHATGGAVDLTLCYQNTPLEMGSRFDDFSPLARTDALEAGPDCAARRHRRMLFWAMCSAGFVNYPGEWWHFSYGDRLWATVQQRQPLYSHCAGAGIR